MTLLVVSPFTANADEKSVTETGATSGTTGDCTWKIENYTLTISGKGKMENYEDNNNKAPWRNYSFTEAIIEDGVTAIGKCAFYNCSGLTKVSIPDTVTSIGIKAFCCCSELTSLSIPNFVKIIGNSAFSGCSGLTYVTIPNSVTTIGECAFDGCTGLTRVIIPDSVTSIGSSAFFHCTGLKSVHISDINAWCKIDFYNTESNPLYYAHNLYYNNDLITELVIPNSVTNIGNKAFYGCNVLTSVTIPHSVTSIGDSAFNGCTGLTSVTIGNSVTSIGHSAFYGCSGLTSINISDSVTSIDSCTFYGCTDLTSITIPDSIKSIYNKAFYGCEKLKNVTIPSSVGYISDKAFGYYKDAVFGTEEEVNNFTIYGYKNTAAEKYANDNRFTFIALDGQPTEPTQSPSVAPFDPTKTTDREIFGDIDGDGEITIVDTTFLQRYTIKAETPYPIGEKMK